MNKRIIRAVAFVLVPCLIVDSTSAAVFSTPAPRVVSSFSQTERFKLQQPFNEQALIARDLFSSRQVIAGLVIGGLYKVFTVYQQIHQAQGVRPLLQSNLLLGKWDLLFLAGSAVLMAAFEPSNKGQPADVEALHFEIQKLRKNLIEIFMKVQIPPGKLKQSLQYSRQLMHAADQLPDASERLKFSAEALIFEGFGHLRLRHFDEARRSFLDAEKLSEGKAIAVLDRLSCWLGIANLDQQEKNYDHMQKVIDSARNVLRLLQSQPPVRPVGIGFEILGDQWTIIKGPNTPERKALFQTLAFLQNQFTGIQDNLNLLRKNTGMGSVTATAESSVEPAKESPAGEEQRLLALRDQNAGLIKRGHLSDDELKLVLANARLMIDRSAQTKQRDWLKIEGGYQKAYVLRQQGLLDQAKAVLDEADRIGRSTPVIKIELRLSLLNEAGRLFEDQGDEAGSERVRRVVVQISQNVLAPIPQKPGAGFQIPSAEWDALRSGDESSSVRQAVQEQLAQAEPFLTQLDAGRKAAADRRDEMAAQEAHQRAVDHFEHLTGSDVLGASLKAVFADVSPEQFRDMYPDVADRPALLAQVLPQTTLSPAILEAVARAASRSGVRPLALIDELIQTMSAETMTEFLTSNIGHVFTRTEGVADSDFIDRALTELSSREALMTVSVSDLPGKVRRIVGTRLKLRVVKDASGEVKLGDVHAAVWNILNEHKSELSGVLSHVQRDYRLMINGENVMDSIDWQSNSVPANSKLSLSKPRGYGSDKWVVFLGAASTLGMLWAQMHGQTLAPGDHYMAAGFFNGTLLIDGWTAESIFRLALLIVAAAAFHNQGSSSQVRALGDLLHARFRGRTDIFFTNIGAKSLEFNTELSRYLNPSSWAIKGSAIEKDAAYQQSPLGPRLAVTYNQSSRHRHSMHSWKERKILTEGSQDFIVLHAITAAENDSGSVRKWAIEADRLLQPQGILLATFDKENYERDHVFDWVVMEMKLNGFEVARVNLPDDYPRLRLHLAESALLAWRIGTPPPLVSAADASVVASDPFTLMLPNSTRWMQGRPRELAPDVPRVPAKRFSRLQSLLLGAAGGFLLGIMLSGIVYAWFRDTPKNPRQAEPQLGSETHPYRDQPVHKISLTVPLLHQPPNRLTARLRLAA